MQNVINVSKTDLVTVLLQQQYASIGRFILVDGAISYSDNISLMTEVILIAIQGPYDESSMADNYVVQYQTNKEVEEHLCSHSVRIRDWAY